MRERVWARVGIKNTEEDGKVTQRERVWKKNLFTFFLFPEIQNS